MNSVLVTGGAGFIGSHVAEILAQGLNRVVIIDDLSGGYKENIPESCIFEKCSIMDHKRLHEIFKKYKFDTVYHLAAYAAENLSSHIKRFNYNNNLIGSINLINESVNNKVSCFVYTSSIAVYGSQQGAFDDGLHEGLKEEPIDSYGIAKLAVEKELKITHDLFGMDYIIFRPHNVYGPRQNMFDKYRNVVSIFINQALHKKPYTIYGDGTQTRSFTYIDDIAKTIAYAPFKNGFDNEIFNIGSDKYYSLNDLTSIISSILGQDNKKVFLNERHESKHSRVLNGKIRALTKSGETTLGEGLAETIQYAEKARKHTIKTFKNIEIRDKLPEGW